MEAHPDDDETMRKVILEVYATGVRPLLRGVITRWRRVGQRPLTVVTALLVTMFAVPVAALYVLLATLVPLTVGFLLAITSPILLCVGVRKLMAP